MASKQKKSEKALQRQQAPEGLSSSATPPPPPLPPDTSLAERLAPFALITIIFLMAVFPQRVSDTWTHLSIGRYVFENHSVPSTEVFLYPIEGAQVSYSEWLFGLVLYGVYSIGGGIDATILFKAAVIALAFHLFWLTARLRGTSIWAFIPIALATAIVIRFRFLERPEIMTYMFLGLSFYLFELYRLKGRRLIYLIPVLQIVWANMHPACTLGIFIAGAYFGASLFSELTASRKPKAGAPAWQATRITGAVFGLTLIATLLTPFPFEPFRMTLEVLADPDLKMAVDETNPITTYPAFFKDFLAMCALWTVFTAIRLYRRQFPALVDILLIGVFVTLPLGSIKGLSVFMLFAMVQTAQGAGQFISGVKDNLRPLVYASLGGLVVLALFANEPPKDVRFGLGVSPGHYPASAMRFVDEIGLRGNIYNLYETGGYLSFHLHPRQRVFIDDRLTSKQAVWDNAMNYGRVLEGVNGWEDILSSHDVSTIMTTCCESGMARTFPLIDRLYDSPDWTLIYAGEDGFVFVKNRPELAQTINRYGLPKTEIYNAILKWAYLQADNPDSSALPLTLGRAYVRLNKPAEAKAELIRWLRVAPNDEKIKDIVQRLTEAGY